MSRLSLPRDTNSKASGASVAETLINLIVRIIGGVVGGYTAGSAGGKRINLGTIANSIVGAVGGIIGGPIFTGLIRMIFGPAHSIDIAFYEQAVGSCVAGAILTILVGAIKNKKLA